MKRPNLIQRCTARMLGLTLLVASCSLGNDGQSSGGSTLTILSPSTPGDGIFSPDWPAKFLLFLPLAERNAEGELEPRLARSWAHSEDYRHWTVHLRTDLKWHDGVPSLEDDI